MTTSRTLSLERVRARTLLFFASVLFGLTALLVRVATRPGAMSGSQASLIRFIVGLLAVSGLFLARPGTFRAANPWLLAVRGCFGGMSAILYFRGLALIPAGQATLLNNTFPLWGVLLSFVLLRERPTRRVLIALAVTCGGVFLVMGGRAMQLGLGRGQLLALASGVCGGAAVTAVRALRATHNAAIVFFSFALGGLLVSSPGAVEGWTSAPGPWMAAIALGFTAFLAQMFTTEAYGALAVAEAGIWQQLTPISSFAWALLVGEPVTATTVVGVALCVSGVWYATRGRDGG